MNVRLLVSFCLFSSLLLQAQERKTLSDLQKGDWFTLEYVQYHSSPEGYQSLRNAEIFEFRVTVSERTLNDIQFIIRPVRVLNYDAIVYSNSVKLSAGIWTGTGLGQNRLKPGRYFFYFDSYFSAELKDKNVNLWNESDGVVLKLNLKDGSWSDTVYSLKNKEWKYPRNLILCGIKPKPGNLVSGYDIESKDAKSVFEEIIGNYFEYCHTGKELPWLLSGNTENGKHYSIKIINASFALAPNVKLSYQTSEVLKNKDLIVEINNQTCHLKHDNDGIIRLDLFLPHPTMAKMMNTVVAITPGDSIHIIKEPDGNVIFSGTGAENCRFWYELSRRQIYLDQSPPFISSLSQYTSNQFNGQKLTDSIMRRQLSMGDSIFQTIRNQHASEMSHYWMESSWLSQQYWNMYKILEFNEKNKSEIDWENDCFQSAMPFIDYVYQPLYYASFLNSYCKFKTKESHNDVFSWHNSDNLFSRYYFQKEFFTGYPKYLLLSGTLLELMKSSAPSDIQKEYNDFITACNDTGLLQKVTQDYHRVLATQPGASIHNLDLTLEEDIPLKKNADGYTVVLMGYLNNKRDLDTTLTVLNDSINIGLNTNVQVIYPDRYRSKTQMKIGNHVLNIDDREQTRAMIDSLNIYHDANIEIHDSDTIQVRGKGDNQISLKSSFMISNKAPMPASHVSVTSTESDDLERDLAILRCGKYTLLLIRNDGTIVAKGIELYDVSKRRIKAVETIRTLIKEDMEIQKKAGLNYSLLITIILSVIFSISVTVPAALFFKNRKIKAIRKMEANKRLITELELRAIRSQMNPHFVFNALSSIQHLINQGKNREANRYLLDFARLLRMVLESSEKKLVSLSDEIEQLKLYLLLEQLRIPFEYRIGVDPEIQPDNEEIPGMLIQPIVENAVKHGVSGMQGGIITIQFSKKAHVLLVEIADNGPGFLTAASPLDKIAENGPEFDASASPLDKIGLNIGGETSPCPLERGNFVTCAHGFGLKAIEERLRLINADSKTSIGIRMENNNPTGAKVIISIPI